MIHNPFGVCDCAVNNWINNCGCSGGTHSYIEPYKQLLRLHKPCRVFEWGPGPNTTEALNIGAEVISVEQDIRWVPPIHHAKWTCILTQVQNENYVSTCEFRNIDLYFIDSRRRAECIELAAAECPRESIVVVHDAQRKRYQDAISNFPFVFFVRPGVAFMSYSDTLCDIFNQMKEE